MTINFNSLPATLRLPWAAIEFDGSRALGSWQDINQNAVILGQMLSTGEAEPLTPVRVISDQEADRLFGAASMLAEMCRAFRAANPYQVLYAVGIDDAAAGVKAAGTVTFTGPATAAGTLALYIGGRRVRVAVAAEDTATEIATATAAAISAESRLPVTATSALGVVTITHRHKGLVGNNVDLRINYRHDEKTPAGVGVTIAAMASGATNPDITSALAALGDQHYWYLICPYTDDANLALLTTELDSRWSWAQAHYMLGFIAEPGTQGEMAALGNTLNSPFLGLVGSAKSPTEPQIVASIWGAVAAYNLNNDPSRPLQSLKLTGMLAPAMADRMPALNRNQLLFEGVSTFNVGDDGFCYAEAAITTYQEDAMGADDASWLWLNIPAQLAQYAHNERALIFRTYPRHKLASDDFPVQPGQAIVRPKDIRALLISNYATLMDKGMVEDLEGYKADLVVERDTSNTNRVNVQEAPRLIGQFMQFFCQVQYRLGGSEV